MPFKGLMQIIHDPPMAHTPLSYTTQKWSQRANSLKGRLLSHHNSSSETCPTGHGILGTPFPMDRIYKWCKRELSLGWISNVNHQIQMWIHWNKRHACSTYVTWTGKMWSFWVLKNIDSLMKLEKKWVLFTGLN